MKSRLLALSLLLVCLLPAGSLAAGSPVWKVEKAGGTLYLAGSVHILDLEQTPLPSGFDQAYAQSQILVLEADVEKMQQPEFLATAMPRLTYPAPATIRDRLEPATLAALESYFADRGGAFEQFERFRPGLLTSVMLVFELQRLGLAGPGVDLVVQQRAADDDKPRKYLETVDEQLDILAGIGDGDEDALIRQSLADAERLPVFWQEMLSAWGDGDLDRMQALGSDDLQRTAPRSYDLLIKRRNRAWLEKLELMLADAPIELVVVGALHLAGEDGLLELLAARGCRVEQLR